MLGVGLLVLLVVMTVQPDKEIMAAAAQSRTGTQLLLEDRISGNDDVPSSDHRTLCLLLGEDQVECNKKLTMLRELKLAEEEETSKSSATENRRRVSPFHCSSPFCSMKYLGDFLRDEKSDEDRLGKRQRRPGEAAAFYSGW